MSSTKRKRKSAILENFDRSDTLVKCKLCEKTFSIKSSHSMLKYHYKKHENCADPGQSAQKKATSKKYFDDLVLNFVVQGNHPFSIVDEEHFEKLINGLNPSYSGLSRTQLQLNIQDVFKEKQNQIVECLKTVPNKIALTLDFWTSVTNKPYMVVTAHFMLDSKLSAIILEFDLLPYPHRGENIMNKLLEIFEIYGIENKITSITTDNEATNVKLLQLLTLFHSNYENVIHTRCLAHVLNLAVKRGLKKIEKPISDVAKLVKVINFSPKKKQMYFETCKLLNVPELSLLQDMSIRWNTVFLMLERAYTMKTVLDHICKEKREFKEYLIENWDDINNLMRFLQPFYDATLLLSKSKYPSLFYVIPIMDILKEQVSSHANEELFEDCAVAMNEKLDEFTPYLYTDFAKFAVLLDPRLKNTYFSERGDEETLLRFKTYFSTHYNNTQEHMTATNAIHTNESGNVQLQSSNKSIFSSVYKQKHSRAQDEVEKYFSLPLETEDTEVLLWWSNQKYHLPRLTQMADDVLCIPASSVPSEQAFSKSGNLITKKRNRLGNKSIRASMCLSSWMNFL